MKGCCIYQILGGVCIYWNDMYWFAYVLSLHSKDKSHLVSLYNPFNWLANICLEFLYLHWAIGFGFGFGFGIFTWFWYQSNADFLEWIWKFSLLLNILGEFEEDFFFKCWVEFSSELSGPGVFCVGIFFWLVFQFLYSLLVQFSIYFWFSFGRFCVSRDVSISSRLCNLLAHTCS